MRKFFLNFIKLISDVCEEDFGWVVKFAFHLTRGTFWGTFAKKKKQISFWFSDFKRKTFGILAKTFSMLVKISFNVSSGTFWWKMNRVSMTVFWKHKTSFHHFWILFAKSYPTFDWSFFAFLSKMQFRFPIDFFSGKTDFLSFSSKHVQTFGKKSLAGRSNFHSTCQGERFEELFWGEKETIFLVFRFWAKNNRIFDKNFPHACQNSILRLQWRVLMKIEFFRMTNFLIILVYWPEKISTCWQKNLKGCQTAIYVSRGKFWCFDVFFLKKTYIFQPFADFERKHVRHLLKELQQVWRNWTLRVQRNVLWIFMWEK